MLCEMTPFALMSPNCVHFYKLSIFTSLHLPFSIAIASGESPLSSVTLQFAPDFIKMSTIFSRSATFVVIFVVPNIEFSAVDHSKTHIIE